MSVVSEGAITTSAYDPAQSGWRPRNLYSLNHDSSLQMVIGRSLKEASAVLILKLTTGMACRNADSVLEFIRSIIEMVNSFNDSDEI